MFKHLFQCVLICMKAHYNEHFQPSLNIEKIEVETIKVVNPTTGPKLQSAG